jgi:hypothetical protein
LGQRFDDKLFLLKKFKYVGVDYGCVLWYCLEGSGVVEEWKRIEEGEGEGEFFFSFFPLGNGLELDTMLSGHHI